MSVAFLFPGQGSQRPGMLHDLPEHPVARDMISRAAGVLGCDVLDLDTPMLSARPSPLSSLCSSPALPPPGYWSRKAGPDFVAGHSVGAFAAAVAAGALAYPDALRLVDLRARAMQEAYPHGYGMGVVVGLDERTVSRLAAESATPKARSTRPTSTRPCRSAFPARTAPWSGCWASPASTAPAVPGASPCPPLRTRPSWPRSQRSSKPSLMSP